MSKKLTDLKELSEVQLECARLMCMIDNKNEIARKLNKNIKTINSWAKLPLFKAEMEKQRALIKEHAEEKLCRSIDIATDKLIELITSPNTSDSVRLGAINTLYDRTLGKVTQKIETKDTTKEIQIDKYDIDNMLDELNIIDVEEIRDDNDNTNDK